MSYFYKSIPDFYAADDLVPVRPVYSLATEVLKVTGEPSSKSSAIVTVGPPFLARPLIDRLVLVKFFIEGFLLGEPFFVGSSLGTILKFLVQDSSST
jgi:hypothetical protein